MQFKMSDNSLFAMLLRSPWWVSFAVALLLGLGGRALLPEGYVFVAPALAFPFVIAGFMALRSSGTSRAKPVLPKPSRRCQKCPGAIFLR